MKGTAVDAAREGSDWGPGSVVARKFPLLTRTALILLWGLALEAVLISVRHLVTGNPLGQDSHAYWLAAQGGPNYGARPGQRDAYLYSPAFAVLIKPLALLPWPWFCAVWLMVEGSVLVWLVKPLRARWAIPLILVCLPELVVGNIYLLLAATAVTGLHRPPAWSFAILTKVSTGVGLLWFATRGEWKALLQGLGATAVIVALFYAIDPSAWNEWSRFLITNRNGTPDSMLSFIARCLISMALVVVGARKRWPFLIAPAMVLASPVLVSIPPWTILAAVPRLLRSQALDSGRSS